MAKKEDVIENAQKAAKEETYDYHANASMFSTEEALYSRPLRTPTLVWLFLVVGWNTFLFIWCCITSHTVFYTNNAGPRGWYVGRTYLATKFVLFLFWALIPMVIWLNSSFELYQRWRRTLTPKRIVITSSCSLFLWILTLGIWSPCVFSSYVFGKWSATYGQPQYCPFPRGPSWWTTYNTDSSPAPPRRPYYLLPWFVIPVLIFYGFYLRQGRRASKSQRNAAAWQICDNCSRCGGHDYNPTKRYKVTSSLYTDADTHSDATPSTLHPEATTPGPSTRPPSYDEKSSQGASIRSLEQAHMKD